MHSALRQRFTRQITGPPTHSPLLASGSVLLRRGAPEPRASPRPPCRRDRAHHPIEPTPAARSCCSRCARCSEVSQGGSMFQCGALPRLGCSHGTRGPAPYRCGCRCCILSIKRRPRRRRRTLLSLRDGRHERGPAKERRPAPRAFCWSESRNASPARALLRSVGAQRLVGLRAPLTAARRSRMSASVSQAWL